MKNVLTIAGSDSGCGAGMQADLKTFAANGVYGLSVITAITAQNTCGVQAIREMDEDIIRAQFRAVVEDIPVHAVKIGMLSSSKIVEIVADELRRSKLNNIVLDTVMVSKSGHALLKPEAVASLCKELIPMAKIVTPNLDEAKMITNMEIDSQERMKAAAREIKAMGTEYVIIKGGHLKGDAWDVLYDGHEFMEFSANRLNNNNTHGTGCTFSSAIAAGLAKGMSMQQAVGAAKQYITTAIKHGIQLGKGIGPTHHFYRLYKKAGMLEN